MESLHFIHPSCCESCCGHTMRGSCLHLALLPKCCFLLPAQRHTRVSSTALVPRPDVGSLDQPPSCKQRGWIQTRMLFCRRQHRMKPHGHPASVRKTFKQKASTHTTTGGSISHLFAQLVRSQLVPEQKSGSQTRRTVCAAQSLLNKLPQPW